MLSLIFMNFFSTNDALTQKEKEDNFYNMY